MVKMMPGSLTDKGRKGRGNDDADKGLGYLEGKVNERVQPVVKALNEMRPIFQENTKAIRDLIKAMKER
jgi:hypothetical protein